MYNKPQPDCRPHEDRILDRVLSAVSQNNWHLKGTSQCGSDSRFYHSLLLSIDLLEFIHQKEMAIGTDLCFYPLKFSFHFLDALPFSDPLLGLWLFYMKS